LFTQDESCRLQTTEVANIAKSAWAQRGFPRSAGYGCGQHLYTIKILAQSLVTQVRIVQYPLALLGEKSYRTRWFGLTQKRIEAD
jgi:hypothetical protein